jgi:release factor glutamine methyltransferase
VGVDRAEFLERLIIRPERADDAEAIGAVVAAAFGSAVEARLVEAIRASENFVAELSLVAELDGRVVGHVMVSMVALHDTAARRRIACLSPLAVAPEWHGYRIGPALVRAVLLLAEARGEPLVVLEGSPAFYGRLGFEYSVPYGIRITLPEWAPAEAAQILRLREYDPAIRGLVVYPQAFIDASDEDAYSPMMPAERVEQIRAWHEANYRSAEHTTAVRVTFFGCDLEVPAEVHPPQGVSDLLADAVLAEVREGDRVLDMGTGSGVNAILAAAKSRDVVAVDVNPIAVECARRNAQRNGVADRIDVRESDVFRAVDGRFDVVVFDPPFRWFAPRDLRERATTDENYGTLGMFFREIHHHLAAEGRVLLFFGTSGDLEYLHHLIAKARLTSEIVATRELERDGQTVHYFTYRLTR